MVLIVSLTPAWLTERPDGHLSVVVKTNSKVVRHRSLSPQACFAEVQPVCTDTIHGPLTATIWGIPDYKKLYESLGILDFGNIIGTTKATGILTKYLNEKWRRSGNQAAENIPQPPSIRPRRRECSAQHHCPNDYRCVASVAKVANTILLEGYCKLSYYSGSQGRRLLSNASSIPVDNATFSALVPPETRDPLTGFGCPCNCTYVSQACCDAPSGEVWEPASFKLGSLAPPNPNTCCDRITGAFRQKARNGNSTCLE